MHAFSPDPAVRPGTYGPACTYAFVSLQVSLHVCGMCRHPCGYIHALVGCACSCNSAGAVRVLQCACNLASSSAVSWSFYQPGFSNRYTSSGEWQMCHSQAAQLGLYLVVMYDAHYACACGSSMPYAWRLERVECNERTAGPVCDVAEGEVDTCVAFR